MRVADTIAGMRRAREEMCGTVGLVPTMGYLHEGHLSLVRRSRRDNDYTVVSIFVNPTQFGPGEDLSRYPRDISRDLGLLEKLGTDVVFSPPPEDMYYEDASSWIVVEKVTDRLEGAVRPGHFRGVATVVGKLFNIVEPHRAYFGQKDAQQVVVIQKIVADLDFNLEVVVCPTVREPDGLAMSSRNSYLDSEQRRAALVLYHSLQKAQREYSAGVRDAGRIRREMAEILQSEQLAEVDYISVASPLTMEELDTVEDQALVSLAVKIGKTRLIDNIVLGG
ncbi:MAG: pantoate--beta-alanine ligase [Dehalococcoidia bacterium]|nr:pantoate--beta-alanine ligase [Dehalococcoidia bacterium]MDP7469540.1 pantoate--beta-alanine ligase [Dehalococcoidia bacterium]